MMSETQTQTEQPEATQKSVVVDTGAPQQWKKYQTYAIAVDPEQDDKAKTIKMCSFARPHMRAFHCSWWGFFMAFFIWFAIPPLLSQIRITLELTKKEIWTSNITNVAGTIAMRFILGPACDKYGARIPMAAILCFAAIPTACLGLVNSATGLAVLRLFIGTAGGTFVMCQFWASRMFTKEVVGTANAICGGWGNLGGGVTQLVMAALLFPAFQKAFDGDAEKAWRTVCVVPAIVTIITGICIYKYSDDAPKGNYAELKKHGTMAEVSAAASFRAGAINVNSWLLFVQYACCFGVELTMNNAAALYFTDQFGLETAEAGAIASIFGFMNLFARPLGGYLSDKGNGYLGMKGRLIAQTVCLLAEGALVLVFAHTTSLSGSIATMVFFSLFVQAAEGTTYGIVPYVDPAATGAISGIVGAGGNVGAVCFGLVFQNLDYKQAFIVMGATIFVSAIFSLGIVIKGHAGLICGKDDEHKEDGAVLTVPVKDTEEDEISQ